MTIKRLNSHMRRTLLGLVATLVVAAAYSAPEAPTFARFQQSSDGIGEEAAHSSAAVDATPSILTLYSEARFWGDTYTATAFPEPVNAADEVITSTQLYVANLQSRISSVRLRCGSRDSHVMLYTGRPAPSQIEHWPQSGIGYPITCTAGTTPRVNLHTDAPRMADKVASVYFVVHGADVEYATLSDLLETHWSRQLPEKLPDERGKGQGDAAIRVLALLQAQPEAAAEPLGVHRARRQLRAVGPRATSWGDASRSG